METKFHARKLKLLHGAHWETSEKRANRLNENNHSYTKRRKIQWLTTLSASMKHAETETNFYSRSYITRGNFNIATVFWKWSDPTLSNPIKSKSLSRYQWKSNQIKFYLSWIYNLFILNYQFNIITPLDWYRSTSVCVWNFRWPPAISIRAWDTCTTATAC